MMTNMTTKSSTTSNFTDKLPDFVHIFSVEEHAYWKPKLLESIEYMIKINNIQLNEKGYYYDFNIPNVPRTYHQLMDNILIDYTNELCERYGLRLAHNDDINKYWFQQYFKGSDFNWHGHDQHWACVYYVELPDPTEATEFLNFRQFDIKEGDVIFFPTFLVHRSPMIKSDFRKTIIATNFKFIVDRELIQNYGEQHFRN